MEKLKKILFCALAMFLLVGCDETNEPPVDNESNNQGIIDTPQEPENPVYADVKDQIIADFNIDKYNFYTDVVYTKGQLGDYEIYSIIMKKAKNMIQKDNECDKTKYGNEEYIYDCQYITYDDLNKIAIDMFGKSLEKTDIRYSLYILVYDSIADVYRISSSPGGGGTGLMDLSKIINKEQVDNNIYIYEKVGYIFKENSQYYMFFPSAATSFLNIGTYNDSEVQSKVQQQYMEQFDTYKWTFEKNENGTYKLVSLELQ